MTQAIISRIAGEVGVATVQITSVAKLLADGNTVPFIARYRKELTGNMDDQLIRSISVRLDMLRAIEEKKEEIKRLIDEQGKLTDELTEKISNARLK